MNIFGIGTDIVNIKRINALIKKINLSKKEFLQIKKLANVKKEKTKQNVLLRDLQPKKLF